MSPRRRRHSAWLPRSWCARASRQRILGEGVRLLQAADQEHGLAQWRDESTLIGYHFHCHGLFHRLREERHGVGDAPGEGIRRTQGLQPCMGNRPGGRVS